jgi:hypothetical protein
LGANFNRDMRALVDWLKSRRRRSVYSDLDALDCEPGRRRLHVKNVPGRKTDVSDSGMGLAQLARFGLLRGGFIAPKDVGELYRIKISPHMALALAGEKKRLHKILDDAGIKLGGVCDLGRLSAQDG